MRFQNKITRKPPHHGIDILFIDSNEEHRSYFTDRLKKLSSDYVIHEVCSGTAGLDLLKRHQFDCVVLELDLPDMSGFKILIDLVPMARTPKVPVIVLTRIPNKDVWGLARENGAFACLWKMYTSGDLLAITIERGLAEHPFPLKDRSPISSFPSQDLQ